jgi:hypothetical protein
VKNPSVAGVKLARNVIALSAKPLAVRIYCPVNLKVRNVSLESPNNINARLWIGNVLDVARGITSNYKDLSEPGA